MLKTYNISPAAVVGHSSGEIAAAFAAGALTLDEAIIIAYYRGQVMLDVDPSSGNMAAVGLGPDEVQAYLQSGVLVGCENSPKNVTITGDKNAVEEVIARIKADQPDVLARLLQVDRAYHSRKYLSLGPPCLNQPRHVHCV